MKFLFVIFLLPLQLFAQDITGVWTGTLYNDTTKQYIKYELAISEYNGKLSGYSHTIFVIDSVENIGVKSIKIKQEGDQVIVTDDKLVYNNYPEPPARGVKKLIVMFFSQNDSAMILKGSWKTNRTKEYSAITGEIFLRKKKNVRESLIIAKLENLGLAHSLSFITSAPLQTKDLATINNPQLELKKPDKENTIAINEKTSNDITSIKKEDKKAGEDKKESNADSHENTVDSNHLISQKIDTDKAEKQKIASQEKENSKNISSKQKKIKSKEQSKTTGSIAAQASSHPENNQITNSDTTLKNDLAVSEKAKSKKTISEKEINTRTEIQKDTTATKGRSQAIKIYPSSQSVNNLAIANNQEVKQGNVNQQNSSGTKMLEQETQKKEDTKIAVNKNQLNASSPILGQQKIESANMEIKTAPAAAEIALRKIETIKTVEIKQDSLLLTLYDNGEIDGDTVSVLLNGKVIMPRQGLMAGAINKTIYLTPDMGDSITLIMYAENLGSIPPNTGLLVVHDGDDVHEIRFSGDLQKSSAIILKRKKRN